MVCKENVVQWFGSLSSYKRIDLMCTLLNMCLPFEVRYLGTCVEDLGKRDYHELRETEDRANVATNLNDLTNLTDKSIRRKLALYMALLHSCNYPCASVLFKNLSNFDSQAIANLIASTSLSQDEQMLEELLLLYIMALNHPSFTYEQKSTFGDIYQKLQEEETRINAAKPSTTPTYKAAQVCVPSCVAQNDRMADPELTTSCMVPPPPIQSYHGDVPMRTNMVTGVPPGLSLPPSGICLPSPEQMTMGSGVGGHYYHMGFPSGANHMGPWMGQMMMGNQFMYHTGEAVTFPASPLVSRQSSPSQSRSPSRSNSPMGRRNSTQSARTTCTSQPTTTAIATTAPISTSTSTAAISSLPPLPSIGTSRTIPSQPPILAAAPPVPIVSTASFSRQNSADAATTLKQPPPPPRLRPSTSTDLLRETLGKEMPNFKSNLQNCSYDEIRRMSDEDLRDIGLPPNVVGQLRNIVKNQTSNGLNQIPSPSDKKAESTNSGVNSATESVDSEIVPGVETQNDSGNTNNKSMPLTEHQTMQNSHTNYRRIYNPPIPPLDHMQMYPAPPPIYAPQAAPCYTCLAFPVPGGQTRFSRCNPQYCVNMNSLKLDSDSTRNYSQSSSSESSGSRSPPETPPAAPWSIGASSEAAGVPPVSEHLGTAPLHSVVNSTANMNRDWQPESSLSGTEWRRKNQGHMMRNKNNNQAASSDVIASIEHLCPGPLHSAVASSTIVNRDWGSQPEVFPANEWRRKNRHMMRHKNNQMVNGGALPSMQHCVTIPVPPSPYIPQGHFPALRPSTGIYSNFSHPAYARPAYPATYQPNGEVMYQYPGHPGSGGTPPPAPSVPVSAQTYIPPAPVVTFPATGPPVKISCYNCGSSNHLAAECKDQTMEDLTKQAQYRLDYTITKQSGECPSGDNK